MCWQHSCRLCQGKNLVKTQHDTLLFPDLGSPWWHSPHNCCHSIWALWVGCHANGIEKYTTNSSVADDHCSWWLYQLILPCVNRWCGYIVWQSNRTPKSCGHDYKSNLAGLIVSEWKEVPLLSNQTGFPWPWHLSLRGWTSVVEVWQNYKLAHTCICHWFCSFLALVQYIAVFLLKLTDHTVVLNPLTTKAAHKDFPTWTDVHDFTFQSIKQLVCSAECLTIIDHSNPGNNKNFVTCDASDWRTSAKLSFGPTWETARPVAFDSTQLSSAERSYPLHEK